MGIGKADSIEDVAKKVEQGVEIIDDYKVVFHLTQAAPEFVENISANTDLVMESKARWDAGGKELYGQKVVGTGPSSLSSAKSARTSSTNGSKTTGARSRSTKELEFRVGAGRG
jgi:ABC-type oligopeptide transport system substrate-binding subunit